MLSDFWFDTFAPTHPPLSQGSYNDNTAFTNLPPRFKGLFIGNNGDPSCPTNPNMRLLTSA